MVLGAFLREISGGMSFLFLLMEVYMGLSLFPVREKDLGSFTFILWILLMNFVVNTFFLLIMAIFWKSSGIRTGFMYYMQSNSGLWPIVFLGITLQCLSDPTGSTSFWGIVSIPNKWYPLCLVAFFSLLSQSIAWNLLIAVGIGYAYPYLRLERFLPSRVRVNRWEQRWNCASNFSCLGGYWIKAVDTAAHEVEAGDRRYATLSDFGRSNQTQMSSSVSTSQAAPSSSLVLFAGSGQRLGDGNECEPMRPNSEEPKAATSILEASQTLEPGDEAE